VTELFEEKDLKEFEEVEEEIDDEVIEVDLEIPESEEVQVADQVEQYSFDQTVDQVIAGEWGKGQDRRLRLEKAGIDHVAVQKELVRRINHR
jgi:predicted Fe-Mo cluster-binding NifX family protein